LIGNNTGGSDPNLFFQKLPPMQRDYANITAELTAFASAAGMLGEISVNTTTEGIMISLSNALLFESGNADLRPEAAESLHKITEILQTTDHSVRIEGHTDNIPTNNPLYPTNWELSVARAVAIVRYLIEKEGVSPERLAAGGYAEFKPKVPNDSRASRAINRRADIVILYPEKSRTFNLGTPALDNTSPSTATVVSQVR
jgi:chemotaxis protein MotB